MVTDTIQPLVWADIEAILETPEAHGISAAEGRVATDDIVEVLVGTGRHTWIAHQDVDDVVYASGAGAEQDGLKAYAASSVAWPEMVEATEMHLYAPALEDTPRPLRWYTDPAQAYLATVALTDDFAASRIWTTVQQPGSHGWRACKWSVFVYHGDASLKIGDHVQFNEAEIEEMKRRYWYDEIRYLDDDIAIGSATAKLYKTDPRSDVEANLLNLLDDPEPEIRINALTALGYLAYKAPIVPGDDMPDRATRLEELSLSEAAIEHIADLLNFENDETVFDHAICTLRAQCFEGRLKPQGLRIRRTLRERLPQISSDTTRKEISKLLRDIPL
ncbi:hypothetical protein [Puniceibacterium sp. IMCC21224]|uniref:hypothetical protein n=1 Tax=Puniceibacterium sp. IMCC21224 TaxID=1618204 RepID=UPI00064D8EBC|nr:hypothetical protein [Puniceibacterium sp. IMCC21224]KMK69024.1 hypothetical protein IMCC21224_113912 [Puniceibacterium sp. IMCC21224]